MTDRPTHAVAKTPKVSGRYLADYMAGRERARRSILRGCKYRPLAKVLQHDAARNAVSGFLTRGGTDSEERRAEAQRLRAMSEVAWFV